MISKKFARQQILRVSRLRNFPSREEEEALRNDLVETLQRASSEATAKQIIDSWLPESGDAPTVADLWRILHPSGDEHEAQAETGPQPGDEPFGGIGDLIDDRVRERIKQIAEQRGQPRHVVDGGRQ